MTDYRLTREFVRREFIFGAMEYSPRITELFDRWLAEELAEAWEEGNNAGLLARPLPTREQIAEELSGWPIGTGYYQTQVAIDEARDMADAVLNLLKGQDR